MGSLGVFRDEFYNAIHVLPAAQGVAGPTATGVIPAAALAGALDCGVTIGGTSQTYTTDTAVNIIAQINNAINTAYKANVGGFASSLAGSPALSGIPNFFNVTWYVTIALGLVTTGATLAGGTGVTLAAIGTLSATALGAGAGTVARYVVSVTGPTTLTMTRVC
jgi:hypothetical protein